MGAWILESIFERAIYTVHMYLLNSPRINIWKIGVPSDLRGCFVYICNDNKQSKLMSCSCISPSVVLRVSNYMGYVSFMSTRVISFKWLSITFLPNPAMTVQRVCLMFVHLIHCIMHVNHIVALISDTRSRNKHVELLQPTVIQMTN